MDNKDKIPYNKRESAKHKNIKKRESEWRNLNFRKWQTK